MPNKQYFKGGLIQKQIFEEKKNDYNLVFFLPTFLSVCMYTLVYIINCSFYLENHSVKLCKKSWKENWKIPSEPVNGRRTDNTMEKEGGGGGERREDNNNLQNTTQKTKD